MTVEIETQEAEEAAPNLYAFAHGGDDPHEVQLVLSPEDRRRFEDLAPKDEAIKVHDTRGGGDWMVERAACGARCYCAARAWRA